MQSVEFTIPDKPISLQRVRSTPKGIFYDPQSVIKKRVVNHVMAQINDFKISSEPLQLQIAFYFEMPKSWSKKKKERMRLKYHTSRSDIDNLIKFILDTFNGILYEDDAQISRIVAYKMWDDIPRTCIRLSELEPI